VVEMDEERLHGRLDIVEDIEDLGKRTMLSLFRLLKFINYGNHPGKNDELHFEAMIPK
jgi:hypothetical protein